MDYIEAFLETVEEGDTEEEMRDKLRSAMELTLEGAEPEEIESEGELLSLARLGWAGPKKGPQGGTYYENTETNERRYQDHPPGDGEGARPESTDKPSSPSTNLDGERSSPGFPPDSEPRRNNPESVADLMRHAREAVWPTATAEEKKAVQIYTDMFYVQINSALREGKELDKTLDKTLAKAEKHLSSLFDKLPDPPPPKPVTVYRGMSVKPEVREKVVNAIRQSAQEGKLIALGGYQSTTTNPGMASSFSHRKPERAINFEIRAKKGILLNDHSVNATENEFLLDKDTQYRFVGQKIVKDAAGKEYEIFQLEQVI